MWLDSHTEHFKYDIFSRKLYDNIANRWGCGDKWAIIQKESINNEWVICDKLLKCIQAKINDGNKNKDLTVRGFWIE